MSRKKDTGKNPARKEFLEAERIRKLHISQQKGHPTAVAADQSKLSHINTYGGLPEFYIDQPFVCRICGKQEIWKAEDQKRYYEEFKGYIGAKAVECHRCRKAKRGNTHHKS